jgi:serine/threonine-protein kinase
MTEGLELLGTTIAGKYRVRRLVGLGGMGAVYEGEHVELGKRVAVKIIDAASSLSSELKTRFKREARAASAVESEHIVQVFDVGSDPEIGLYMVMEYLVGEDLEMRLRKQPGRRLDHVFVAQVGHQVARALVKAHAARVIHRDLKPANIFLTAREDGTLRVKVLDFGISKLVANDASVGTRKEILALTQEGVALGTPQYMSPEQAQGLTTIDHRTDIWSLGAVLFEAVAGRPAYPELPTYEEVIMKILLEKPPPLEQLAPSVPIELAEVIHDALQHDVARRIPDAATFAARLAQAVPGAMNASSGPFYAVKATGAAKPASRREPPQAHSIPPGDDTQVVIRPGEQDNIAFDEEIPSKTMIAAGVSPSAREPPKVIVRDRTPSAVAREEVVDDGEQGPDPTMFQAPAWVEKTGAGDGPTTLKTAIRSLSSDGTGRGSSDSRGVMAAAVTALLVIGVGGGLILLTQRATTDQAAAPADSAGTPMAVAAPAPPPAPPPPPLAAPAPPPTGTGEPLGEAVPPASAHPKDAARDAGPASPHAAARGSGR